MITTGTGTPAGTTTAVTATGTVIMTAGTVIATGAGTMTAGTETWTTTDGTGIGIGTTTGAAPEAAAGIVTGNTTGIAVPVGMARGPQTGTGAGTGSMTTGGVRTSGSALRVAEVRSVHGSGCVTRTGSGHVSAARSLSGTRRAGEWHVRVDWLTLEQDLAAAGCRRTRLPSCCGATSNHACRIAVPASHASVSRLLACRRDGGDYDEARGGGPVGGGGGGVNVPQSAADLDVDPDLVALDHDF